MKKTKFLCKLTSLVLTLSIAIPIGTGKLQYVSAAENTKTAAENTKTASQQYVDAMGRGWNLGNTLEAFDWNSPANSNETTWGQPVVTPEFMVALKAKGFDSIRIPFAASPAYTQDSNGHYVINQTRLARYKQVVDEAVAAGLYVQVDLHDVWNFITNKWNGDKSQVPYLMFTDFWTQLADTFKDEPNQVCFETANEPDFGDEKDSTGKVTISRQDKLNMINQAAFDIIRHSGGNNAKRMIIIPSIQTNYGTTEATYNWISALNDPNLIATVHWYSEWYYAAAIGRTGFDEELYPDRPGFTPRSADQVFFDAINTNLISKGVGVIVGEFGLLTTDIQTGEEAKYFEDMYSKANQYKHTCLMIWDCNILNRNDMSWYKPLLGRVIDADLKGELSSYVTGLDEIYLSNPVDNDLQIPLTLNGNTFKSIDGLTAGTDYTYDEATATVTLSKAYVNSKFNALGDGKYGSIAELVFKFSAGGDWHQYLIKYASPVLKSVTGTTSGVSIPVDFNGTELRRARAVMLNDDGTDGAMLGGCSSWGWPWLSCGEWNEFIADYNKKVININSGLLTSGSIPANGKIKLYFELYDGQTVNYILTKSGSNITGEAPNTVPVVTTIAINPTTPNGNDGWYTSDVTVSLTTNDNSSSVAKTEYSLDGGTTWQTYKAPFTLNKDGQYTVSYRSTDKAGNVETVKSISFKLDLTGPTITASNVVNGTYNDSSDITPVITLDDKFSGVDSSKTSVTLDGKSVQQGAAIQLYTLPLGSHTLIVTASDMAGNTSSQTIVFQTTTSIKSMQALVTRFKNAGWINNAGIANSLQSKLTSNSLAALVNEVKAQRGKHISTEAADFLIRDAQYLLSKTAGK